MNSAKKIAVDTAKGLGALAGKTIFESGKQAARVVEDVAEGVVGGSQPSQPAQSQANIQASDLNELRQAEESKAEAEKEQLRGSISGSDLEKEIEEVREKKKEKVKEEGEIEFLKKLSEERVKESEVAQNDALAATGRKPQRGSAFAGPKGTGEKVRKKD